MKNKTFYLKINKPIIKYFLKHGELTMAQAKQKYPVDKWLSSKSNQIKMTFKQSLDFSSHEHMPFTFLLNKHLPKDHWEFKNWYVDKSKKNQIPSMKMIDAYCPLPGKQEFFRNWLLLNDNVFKFRYAHAVNKIYISNKLNQTNALILSKLLDVKKISHHTTNLQQAYVDLMNHISHLGIMVMQNNVVDNSKRTLDPNKFLGLALADKVVPLIFVNTNASLKARFYMLVRGFINVCMSKNEMFNTTINHSEELDHKNVLIHNMINDILKPLSNKPFKHSIYLKKMTCDPEFSRVVVLECAEGKITFGKAAEMLNTTLNSYNKVANQIVEKSA